MNTRATGPPEIRPYPNDAMAGRPTTRKPTPFGVRLIALREAKGLTQTELADQIGVRQQRIAYYERRAVSPSVELVAKLATVLGVRVEELAGLEEPSGPRRHPGPRSQLDERVEKIRQLPKKKQALVLEVLDALLEKHA